MKGPAETIRAVYPHTPVQICIVYWMRNSLDYAGCKDRKRVTQALRLRYTVVSEEMAFGACCRPSPLALEAAELPGTLQSCSSGSEPGSA